MIGKILNQIVGVASGGATKLALVVRTDLKMGKGKTGAQCAHAAVLCYQLAVASRDERHQQVLQRWLRSGQPKIVLRVNDGEELTALQQHCHTAGIVAALVCDAGRTQLAPNTATVLGIGPAPAEAIDELVKHLKLL